MSQKITGEESVYPDHQIDGYGGSFHGQKEGGQSMFSSFPGGIPIRLWIATQLMAASGCNVTRNLKTDAEDVLRKADFLISVYNNTPNPNAP